MTRAQAQIQKFLDPDFTGVEIDPVLYSVVHDSPKGFKDPRYCLVFWARPTNAVKELVAELQGRVREIVPGKSIAVKAVIKRTSPCGFLSFSRHLTSGRTTVLTGRPRQSPQ